MQSVLRLHPMLEDMELRQAYQECEQSLGYKPKKGKCLMRNSGITIDDVRASFTDELTRADAKHYYNTAMDWSDGNGQMRVDWVAVVRNIARNDSGKGKLKISKHIQDGGSNLGGQFKPEPASESAITRAEWKQTEEYKSQFGK